MADVLTVPVALDDKREEPTASVPELQNGDNLTVSEFLRRYEAMPADCDAELIEGIVYMASPVSHTNHGRPHQSFGGLLFTYQTYTPLVDGGDNSTTTLDLENAPQPDLLLRIDEKAGGSSREVGDYLEGPPELVVEIAASSASIDLNQKKRAYRRNGVKEYVVWRTLANEIDWFILDGGDFVLNTPAEDGLLKSRVFPGLWLDAAALVKQDLPAVRTAVEAGCKSEEHAAFVKRLTQAAEK